MARPKDSSFFIETATLSVDSSDRKYGIAWRNHSPGFAERVCGTVT
jgi:hypothetical protein